MHGRVDTLSPNPEVVARGEFTKKISYNIVEDVCEYM